MQTPRRILPLDVLWRHKRCGGISDRHIVWTQLPYSIGPSNAHPAVMLSGTPKRPDGAGGLEGCWEG